MKPMDKIRKLARRNWSGLGNPEIARRLGVTTQYAWRFMTGVDGSEKIGEYLAEKYGGEFIPLLDQYRRERRTMCRAKMALARKARAEKEFPSPKEVVDMPQKEIEHHPLIDLTKLGKSSRRFAGFAL